MSRIIVNNLPQKITEEKLRKIFGEKGTLTDIQLKFTTDGKFRQFAFIGYKNENEAQEAIKDLDRTFIKTNKIRVELCTGLGDPNKPKAWSKYAPDSIAYKKSHPEDNIDKLNVDGKQGKKPIKNKDKNELLVKYKDDPLFEEFLQLHAPNEAKKLHSITEKNDEDETEKETVTESLKCTINSNVQESKGSVKEKQKKEPKQIKLFQLKLKGLPKKCKKKDVKEFFKPLHPFSIRVARDSSRIAFVGFKLEKDFHKASMKDRSFMGGNRISVKAFGDMVNSNTNNNKNPLREKWKRQEESLANEEEIGESGRIFFRNLSYTANETDLEGLFSKFGPLAEIHVPIDPSTRQIKGFGTVTFVMPENAVAAYSNLDGTVFHGRMLHLLPGKVENVKEEANLEETSNYKKKKSAKEKAQANSSHNWNSLFLGQDAVAKIMSEKLLVSKKELLVDDQNAAVNLALGETRIVAETKKYLQQNGVLLDAFDTSSTKKSKTVLLVKNLPERTEIHVIREMFGKYGTLGRVILPPSGITAIVEFLNQGEAKKAYAGLAYTKFKHTPLYLEWAPENSLLETTEFVSNAAEEKKKESNSGNLEKTSETNVIHDEVMQEEVDEEEEPEDDTTLFVKNLNFQTTDMGLRKHFEKLGKLCYATVATKKDKSNPQITLSMGYGFVRYYYKKSADKALVELQQSVLDGKSLELKRSQRALQNDLQNIRKKVRKVKQTGTKILVRNVPFEATFKEVLALFKGFGKIKSLRLPQKKRMDTNSHRGFAFVDFLLASNAKSAFDALSMSTHLYGRRLVLEWATIEEDVDQLRKKTANTFGEPSEAKKSKTSVFSIE